MLDAQNQTSRSAAAVTMPRARKDGLVIREVDDETLVYDLERDEAYYLNQTAALVWKQCDGITTVEETTSVLHRECRAPVDIDVVWLALKQLQRFHLIDQKAGAKVGGPSVSRRRLLLKYAPAALALPLIMSISAPAPASAASCGTTGHACGSGHPSCCGGFTCQGGTCHPID